MNQNNPILKYALTMIEQNPQLQNNPRARQIAEIIRSGDDAKGEEMADNLIKSYGCNSREEALKQALNFFPR